MSNGNQRSSAREDPSVRSLTAGLEKIAIAPITADVTPAAKIDHIEELKEKGCVPLLFRGETTQDLRDWPGFCPSQYSVEDQINEVLVLAPGTNE